MTFEEFEGIIEESLAGLPDEFTRLLRDNGIAVVPRDRLPAAIQKEYRNQTVFGMFIGVPYGQFWNIQKEPTRIELYLKSFIDAFDTPKEIRDQIRRTVVHEVGHYFGFSEKEIRKLGY